MSAPNAPVIRDCQQQTIPIRELVVGDLVMLEAVNYIPVDLHLVVTENGSFAARLSGTEDIYKIYAESFRGADHLRQIFGKAHAIVAAAFEEEGL